MDTYINDEFPPCVELLWLLLKYISFWIDVNFKSEEEKRTVGSLSTIITPSQMDPALLSKVNNDAQQACSSQYLSDLTKITTNNETTMLHNDAEMSTWNQK